MYDDLRGDFSPDDLANAEAAWSDETSAPKPKSRARPGKQDPNWKPRQKGEKINYDSPEYQKAAEDAMRGLPVIRALKWLQAQLRDGGVQRGRSQFSVKLEFSDAPIEHSTRAGLKAMQRTRWANLSTVANFRTNLRRKDITPHSFDQADRDNGEFIVKVAHDLDRTHEGAPSCLIGWVSHRFEGKGTIVYGSQHVVLAWRYDGENWLPTLIITRRKADGSRETNFMDMVEVPLHLPSPVNRDGTPRSEAARRFTHVGTWYSPALQERIDTAKGIKAMRAADIAARDRS